MWFDAIVPWVAPHPPLKDIGAVTRIMYSIKQSVCVCTVNRLTLTVQGEIIHTQVGLFVVLCSSSN